MQSNSVVKFGSQIRPSNWLGKFDKTKLVKKIVKQQRG